MTFFMTLVGLSPNPQLILVPNLSDDHNVSTGR